VSPAAISGAVRYLISTRLIYKEREPGSRADLYRVHQDDVWSAITLARLEMLQTWEDAIDQAVTLIDPRHPGGRRLRETKEFVRFTREETLAMVDRWKKHRAGRS
jgi:DNA-binding transcriptional regulator GbsR (MarR family)